MLEIIIIRGRNKVQIANIQLIHSILRAVCETPKKYWLAWDFSMSIAWQKFGRTGENFEDMWKDIYRMGGCFQGCVCGYGMLEADRKLIDTSKWLNCAFLHREEFTSRWHREFVRNLDIQRSTDSTVDRWFTSPLLLT